MFRPARANVLPAAASARHRTARFRHPLEVVLIVGSSQTKDQRPTAALLSLLRAGEQSAAAAFGRIANRFSTAEFEFAQRPLARLVCDEERHDAALAVHASRLPNGIWQCAKTRRFFTRLESREPHIHLARVAALDGCVCQVLHAILNPRRPSSLDPTLAAALAGIRLDEAMHVSVARDLCLALGLRCDDLARIASEVRYEFAALLSTRAGSFEGLGVDTVHLMSRIRRVC